MEHDVDGTGGHRRPLKKARVTPGVRSHATEAARSFIACFSCRNRKIKCSGTQPCRYCIKRGLECTIAEPGKRKLYSVEYVEELESKVAAGNDISSSSISKANSGFVFETPDGDMDTGLSPTQAVTSSSLHFGQEIKSLGAIASPATTNTPYDTQGRHTSFSTPSDAYGVGSHGHEPSGPTTLHLEFEDAQQLLDQVLSSLGKLHHFFDPRAFCDRLSAAYDDSGQLDVDRRDLWYPHFLMVMAIGHLLRGRPSDAGFPGLKYYVEAEACLPNPIALRRSTGTLGIEILGMMAFFLQCADLREDAYIYASLALRLAMARTMAVETDINDRQRSASAHRRRLWWTLYMQERRLAASTGQPLSIHDDSITVRLPTESPGFPNSGALNANIRLARITGLTMHVLYNIHSQKTISSYKSAVQSIVQQLSDIARSIPSEHALDFNKPLSGVTRTSATLYLMLFQCIMLATRPALLQLARLKLVTSPNANKSAPSLASALETLSDVCIEAAGRCLAVLEAMRDQELIATFGFFDLDATISTTFVFVLVKSIYPNSKKELNTHNIQRSSTILHFLASKGNKAAAKRQSDVDQMCKHLGIDMEVSSTGQGVSGNEEVDVDEGVLATADYRGPRMDSNDANNEWRQSPEQSRAQRSVALDMTDATMMPLPPEGDADFDWSQATFSLFEQYPLQQETQDGTEPSNILYEQGMWDVSGTYADDLALTGIMETDWVEIGRHLANFQS